MNATLIIEERAPFAEGADFGPVGAYERINGRVRFAIDPRQPANQHIVDLTLAPADGRGLVEYSTEFFIIKPVDVNRGNRRLLYDVNNRGNKRALQFFNDAPPTNDPRTAQDAGHGFLMRRGYTVVWCGWQGDLLPGDGRLTMALPTAAGPDGALTGPFRAEFIIEQPGVTTVSLGGHDYIRPCPSRGPEHRSSHPHLPAAGAGHPAAHPHKRLAIRCRRRGRQRRSIGHELLPSGRFPARLDLRADLHREGPAGAGAGLCRGT